MKLRQVTALAHCSVIPTQLRPPLIIEAPSSLPSDFVAEEDLIEASALPLTPAERIALIAVGLAPFGASDRRAHTAAELPENLAQAIAAARMDPKYDFLNVILLEPAQVSDFIFDWLKTGTRAASLLEQAQLFGKFMYATQLVRELTDEELATELGVSRRTVRQWSKGNCKLARDAQESLLRRLAAVAGAVG